MKERQILKKILPLIPWKLEIKIFYYLRRKVSTIYRLPSRLEKGKLDYTIRKKKLTSIILHLVKKTTCYNILQLYSWYIQDMEGNIFLDLPFLKIHVF